MFESIIKESMEEASIAEEVVRKHARSAGSISYYFRCVYIVLTTRHGDMLTWSPFDDSTAEGWLQPEIQ
jgi:hypothetical protein